MRVDVLPQSLVDEIRQILDVKNDPDAFLTGDGARYADKDMSFHPPAPSAAVALPLTTAQVAAIVKACAAHRVPIVPRGAGTGVEGGCIPYSGGLVIDTQRMRKIVIDDVSLTATVGPGVLKSELAKALQPHGLLFGPDPSSNPSLGGMASTGGSGMTTLKYGTTRENVVSLEVVTPQGRAFRTRQNVRKASTGYELNQLYMGSEGTLGVITELCVRLFPAPPLRAGAVVAFPAVGHATRAVVQLLRAGSASLRRCELLNAEGVAVTNAVYGTHLPARPTLFLEFAGDDAGALERDAAAARGLAERNGAVGWQFAADGHAIDDLWDARRGCYLAAAKYRKRKDHVHVTDVCVPIARLADTIEDIERGIVERGFPCVICAHIADGNFHALIPYQPGDLERIHEVDRFLTHRAISAGGAVSGEHGIGVGKRESAAEEHGPVHVDVQRRIKRALDPLGIMNPGKFLPEEGASPHPDQDEASGSSASPGGLASWARQTAESTRAAAADSAAGSAARAIREGAGGAGVRRSGCSGGRCCAAGAQGCSGGGEAASAPPFGGTLCCRQTASGSRGGVALRWPGAREEDGGVTVLRALQVEEEQRRRQLGGGHAGGLADAGGSQRARL